jgi:hypothetical protein
MLPTVRQPEWAVNGFQSSMQPHYVNSVHVFLFFEISVPLGKMLNLL